MTGFPPPRQCREEAFPPSNQLNEKDLLATLQKATPVNKSKS
jgi:hypothetical protein